MYVRKFVSSNCNEVCWPHFRDPEAAGSCLISFFFFFWIAWVDWPWNSVWSMIWRMDIYDCFSLFFWKIQQNAVWCQPAVDLFFFVPNLITTVIVMRLFFLINIIYLFFWCNICFCILLKAVIIMLKREKKKNLAKSSFCLFFFPCCS